MNINDLDEALRLRTYRKKAIELKAALRGPMECHFWYEGQKYDPFALVPCDPVRDAIEVACDRFIAEQESALRKIGVTIDD